MNASSRAARQIIKARRSEAKAHSMGLHTLASHTLRAGVTDEFASSIAGALRSKGKATGVTGCTAFMVRRTAQGVRPVRNARRYSKSEFLILAHAYNPRATKYVAARELLLSY